jgi:hypothetical protein
MSGCVESACCTTCLGENKFMGYKYECLMYLDVYQAALRRRRTPKHACLYITPKHACLTKWWVEPNYVALPIPTCPLRCILSVRKFVIKVIMSKGRFPLRPYRTVTYRWACADWKEVYKSTYFRVYSRIKIKSSSQVNFLAYYGSTNQSTFTKFWNLKFVLIRCGTLRLKWKTALRAFC